MESHASRETHREVKPTAVDSIGSEEILEVVDSTVRVVPGRDPGNWHAGVAVHASCQVVAMMQVKVMTFRRTMFQWYQNP